MKSLAAACISGKRRIPILLLPALALLAALLIALPVQASENSGVSESDCNSYGNGYAWSAGSCIVLNSVLIMASSSNINLGNVPGSWTVRYSHSIGSITVINATRSGKTSLSQLDSQMNAMRRLTGVISVEYDTLASAAGPALDTVQSPDNGARVVVTPSNPPASGEGAWFDHRDLNPATCEIEDKRFCVLPHNVLTFGSGWHPLQPHP